MLILIPAICWVVSLTLFVGLRVKATKSRPDRGIPRRLLASRDRTQAASGQRPALPVRF
jgi:hypothetical protein